MRLVHSDHFIRYCKPSQCTSDGKVLNLAFRLRPGEISLSGDHFEYYKENHYENILLALQKRQFTPSRNGKLVKLNCGEVISKIQFLSHDEVFFERDTIGSHTGLFGILNTHSSITELLCSCIRDQFPK
jgi:hypothetical protein